MSPLGFVLENASGKMTNYNYYDSSELCRVVLPFVIKCLEEQLDFGIERNVCFGLVNGNSLVFLEKLNVERKFFCKNYAISASQIYCSQYLGGRRG